MLCPGALRRNQTAGWAVVRRVDCEAVDSIYPSGASGIADSHEQYLCYACGVGADTSYCLLLEQQLGKLAWKRATIKQLEVVTHTGAAQV